METVSRTPISEEIQSRAADCDQYRHDWVLLVFGALDADLKEEMSLHLRQCPECAADFMDSGEVADAIITVAPDEVTPVIETLVAQRSAARSRRWSFRLPAPPPFVPWLLVAVCIVCLVLVSRQRDALLGEHVALEYFASHEVGHVDLRSVHSAWREASGHAVWSPDSGLLFVADHLPAPPPDKCYQLWLLRRSHPTVASAGVVRVGADGRGVLFLPPGEPLRDLTGLLLTDEPAGGSIAARGQRLLEGIR
jgi:hypothetical protein